MPRPAGLWLFRASGGLLPLDVTLPLARGGWLLVASLIATAWMWWRGALARWWVLPAVVAAGCAAHVATFSSHRFAVPFLPVIFVMVAGPLASATRSAWQWASRGHLRQGVLFAIVLLTIAFQWTDGPREIALRAAALDASIIRNVVDPESGRLLRFVPAAVGARVAVVLADECLPKGPYQLLVTAKRGAASTGRDTAVARVTVAMADGSARCGYPARCRSTVPPPSWSKRSASPTSTSTSSCS